MLAFFGNLAPTEVLVLAVVAVLVFGKRLPEVAGRGYTQLRRWRQSLDQLRRDTGIDQELRNLERGVRDVKRQANIEAYLREEQVEPPSEPVVEATPEAELPATDAGNGEPASTEPKP